jgi:hypothetical protein
MEAVRSFLDYQDVQTATKLHQLLGIIGGAGGLLKYLKWKRGRRVREVRRLTDRDSTGNIIVNVTIEGEGNSLQISDNVFELSKNKKVLNELERTLEPLEHDEAGKIEFISGEDIPIAVDKADVKAIIASCEADPSDDADLDLKEEPQRVTTTLHVYSPVFDKKAKTWRFNYKGKHIYADISETQIASDTVKRGVSGVDDRYRVRMEVTPPETEGGEPHYKIVDVLDFTPAPQQASLKLGTRRPKKLSQSLAHASLPLWLPWNWFRADRYGQESRAYTGREMPNEIGPSGVGWRLVATGHLEYKPSGMRCCCQRAGPHDAPPF